jgi:hypothetical protein
MNGDEMMTNKNNETFPCLKCGQPIKLGVDSYHGGNTDGYTHDMCPVLKTFTLQISEHREFRVDIKAETLAQAEWDADQGKYDVDEAYDAEPFDRTVEGIEDTTPPAAKTFGIIVHLWVGKHMYQWLLDICDTFDVVCEEHNEHSISMVFNGDLYDEGILKRLVELQRKTRELNFEMIVPNNHTMWRWFADRAYDITPDYGLAATTEMMFDKSLCSEIEFRALLKNNA